MSAVTFLLNLIIIGLIIIIIIIIGRKEGNVLFNDALNTFYFTVIWRRLYGERGNPLPPHGLFFPINSKGSFICTIPQTG